MLTLLNISNIALIDELRVELDRGLNLLTGETGSGKSIIVDALGVLIGGRFSSEMIKNSGRSAFIEGLFLIGSNRDLDRVLQNAGIETNGGGDGELLVRRELSSGRNRIFINNQLATLSLLREIRPLLVDIHGQGEQQTLFNPDTHLEILDAYAGLAGARRDSSVNPSIAKKTHASSRATVPISMMWCCPTCCTCRSCAAMSRAPASRDST